LRITPLSDTSFLKADISDTSFLQHQPLLLLRLGEASESVSIGAQTDQKLIKMRELFEKADLHNLDLTSLKLALACLK